MLNITNIATYISQYCYLLKMRKILLSIKDSMTLLFTEDNKTLYVQKAVKILLSTEVYNIAIY